MPLGDVAGEAPSGTFRFIARIVFEIVVDVILRGTGAMILRLLHPKHESGETAAMMTGLVFWGAAIRLFSWCSGWGGDMKAPPRLLNDWISFEPEGEPQ